MIWSQQTRKLGEGNYANEPYECRFSRSKKSRYDRYWHSLLSFKQSPETRSDASDISARPRTYVRDILVVVHDEEFSGMRSRVIPPACSFLQHPSRRSLIPATFTGTCDDDVPDDDRRPAPGAYTGSPRRRVEVRATPPVISLVVPNHLRRPPSPPRRTMTDTKCAESAKKSSLVSSWVHCKPRSLWIFFKASESPMCAFPRTLPPSNSRSEWLI